MSGKSNNRWIKEMIDQYYYWQGKWYGDNKKSCKQPPKKKQEKHCKGQPVKRDKKYYQQAMNHCSKKFKECDKYGNKVDECRQHYLEKFKRYKQGHESCVDQADRGCQQSYQQLLKVLNEISGKYYKSP